MYRKVQNISPSLREAYFELRLSRKVKYKKKENKKQTTSLDIHPNYASILETGERPRTNYSC